MTDRKRIILLLDESSSMMNQRFDVVRGVNDMIRQQRNLQTDNVDLSIIKFNTRVDKIRSDNLFKMKRFEHSDYNPSGMTALYDAIGLTIERFMNDINVIMIIVTDGEENSSKEFTRREMVRLINRQRNSKNWNFIYLSEDPTTVQQGESLGINNYESNCSNVLIGKKQSGQTIGSSTLQNYICDVSKGMTKQNFNEYAKRSHIPQHMYRSNTVAPKTTGWNNFYNNVTGWFKF